MLFLDKKVTPITWGDETRSSSFAPQFNANTIHNTIKPISPVHWVITKIRLVLGHLASFWDGKSFFALLIVPPFYMKLTMTLG